MVNVQKMVQPEESLHTPLVIVLGKQVMAVSEEAVECLIILVLAVVAVVTTAALARQTQLALIQLTAGLQLLFKKNFELAGFF